MQTTASFITPIVTLIFVENVLNEELNYISPYFYQNELILNLKKGKTVAMVFGTAKR